MRAIRWSLVGTSLLVASAACTLFVSTGDLSSSNSTPDASDAGLIADGNTTDDADSDGGVQPDGGGTWCDKLSPKPLFCADFDKSDRAADTWDTFLATGSADGGTDDVQYSSPPRSFGAKSPTATTATAFLQKTFVPVVTSQAELGFDVLVSPQSYWSVAAVIELSAGYSIGLTLNGQLHESLPTYQATNFTVASWELWWQSWRHVAIELHVPQGGTAGWVTVRYRDGNGSETLVVDHHPVTSAIAAGTPTVKLGIMDNGSVAWAGHFDNVTFDVK